MKALKTEKKTDGLTYNRTKSDQDSVRYRHKTEPNFVGSGFHPPERFVPLLAKFSHPANATQRVQVFNQLQRRYGNRYVQRVVSAYRSQNGEEGENELASEILSKKGSGRPLEPGNLAVQRLFKSGVIQAKLRIGQPGDIYEQEADRVAEQVIRMVELQVQQQLEEEKKSPETGKERGKLQTKMVVQRNSGENATPATPELEAAIERARGSGQAMPDKVRVPMEQTFGADFSGVRVHSDSNAAQISRELNAEAFTHGRDIYFGAGIYSPSTSSGKRLLAHELTHVIQQDLNSSVTKIQRVVEGDITEMSITEDWARNLNDAELEEQINILGNQLPTLDPATPEYDAARQNLRILEGEAARRLQPVVEGDITEMSITEDWARNLNDAELEEQINILGNQLPTLDPATPEYDAARQNLRILEGEAARRLQPVVEGEAARRLQPPYLVIAESEYRRGVVEDPECTNRGLRVDVYTGISGSPPVISGNSIIRGRCGRAWCADFVKWCLGDIPNPLSAAANSVSRWTSCYYERDGVRFRNPRTSDVIDPLSGDIFFIGRGDTSPPGDPCYIPNHPCDTGACVRGRGLGSGHCGFVRSVSGNTIRTIEGNVHISETNDGVDTMTRNISQLAGIVRIPP